MFDRTCNWSRVVSGGRYFWFGFGSVYSGWPSLSGSGVRVRVCVWVRFGNVINNSRWAFVGQFRAAWPARRRVGVVDSKIGVELQWINYLFIHVALWWFTCSFGTIGVSCGHVGQEGCLGETCCHATAVRSCFQWSCLLVTSVWKHVVGRWKEVVISREVMKKGDLWWEPS